MANFDFGFHPHMGPWSRDNLGISSSYGASSKMAEGMRKESGLKKWFDRDCPIERLHFQCVGLQAHCKCLFFYELFIFSAYLSQG